MDSGDDPYVILGVSPTATTKEIKKAYFKLCREFHPDKASNDKEEEVFTAKMFKINDAKEILLDEQKRKEYDENKKNGSGTNASEPGGAYERPKPPPKPKPRPKPGNLGRTYEGRMGSYTFSFTGDGDDGERASSGHDGRNGQSYGERGRDGSDASPAGHGYAAGDLEINLKTTVSEDGYFEVEVFCVRGKTDVMDLQSENLRVVPLKVFEKVEWTARGGDGGRGGIGGDGGNGYRGYNGADAKHGFFGDTRGGDGGDGGNGGNGGRGTNGGSGGRGGDVDIVVHRSDVYLLMRVAGCDPRLGTGSRQVGGSGGAAGRHGRGGSGGAGGRGGSPAHYSTSHDEYRDGTRYTVYTEHVVPGGSNGRNGRRGATPSDYLRPGQNGMKGNFQIRVKEQNGAERRYEHRYDLAFQSTSTKKLSNMKGKRMFEFGETVIVIACSVKNTGGMETPSHRVAISFDEAHLVQVERQDRLFLPRNRVLARGDEGNADQGSLRFTCPYPQVMGLGTDYDPVRKDGSMRYRAHQLGPENLSHQLATISDFQERYPHFHESTADVAHMAFPIENRDGIRGVRSLAPQETTILELSLNNISNQSFGLQSETERALFVQFYYADDMDYSIPLKDIRVRGDGGRVIDIDSTKKPKGHRHHISFLPRAGDKNIQLSFKLAADEVPTCASAALQADIYIQKIPTLHPDGSFETHTQKRLMQRRQYVVSCQPKFVEEENSDVVLVTTTANNDKQVAAWEFLIKERLGLLPQVYSLSRYGHLDAGRSIESMEMESAFSQKLVIVLNEQYCPQPNVEKRKRATCRPTKLLKSAYDFEQFTRFLVVGGGSKAVEHLSPRATCVNTVAASTRNLAEIETKPNRKSFRNDLAEALQNERGEGFQTERVAPVCHKVKIKTTTLFEPKAQKIEQILVKRTAKMKSWLKRQDALRPYVVEWENHESPVQLEKKTFRKSWEIGDLKVYTGPPRFQNSMVLVGEEGTGCALSTPVSIGSRSMLYSTLNAAHFRTKIRCLCRSLEALVDDPKSEDHLEVCEVVIDCLVGDFVWDIANYLDGRLKIENAADRAQTLRDLIADEQTFQLVEQSLSNEQLCKVATTQFSVLIASLKCVAKSKDLCPWWSPFSRKHAVRKAMLESISLLEERWQYVLDEETMTAHQEMVESKAKLHIKKDRKKRLVRTKGRWRAALAVMHSPKNVERYPQVAGISPANVRVRKHAEFESGQTTKIKAFFPETSSPKETEKVQQQLTQRLEYSTNVLTTTNSDRREFIQHD